MASPEAEGEPNDLGGKRVPAAIADLLGRVRG
jgi:hypothetical protein